MKILSRYVLQEWALSFFGTYVVISCLLLLDEVYKNFYFFIKSGAKVLDLITHCAYLIADVTPMIIPFVIFISTIFSIGQLHRRNEITAMKSSGINLLQLSKPIIIFCICLGLISVWIEAFISPIANDKISTFRIQCDAKAGYETSVRNLGFTNFRDNRVWFIPKFDKFFNLASDVTIFCHDNDGHERKRIYAKFAQFQECKWIFSDCTVTKFDLDSGLPSHVDVFEKTEFSDFSETPKVILASEKKTKNLSFSDLMSLRNFSEKNFYSSRVSTRFHKIFSNAGTCVLLVLLSLPFAVTGLRVNPLVNIAKSLILLIIFILLRGSFSIFGSHGLLSPIIAAWGAQLISLIPAIMLFRKSI